MEREILLSEIYEVKGRDFKHGGEVSSSIRKLLKRMGIPSKILKRISIATYEAEMNIIIYAYKGKITLKVYKDKVRVIAQDEGPGIPDIELAMQEGYSTAPPEVREMGFGAGMGLPNIKKNSDRMKIVSKVGKGTKVEFEVDLTWN